MKARRVFKKLIKIASGAACLLAVLAVFRGPLAWAAGDLDGETYVFKGKEALSSVLWDKMGKRHLQGTSVRLYGGKGLIKQTLKMNPSLHAAENVPPGTRIYLPKIPDQGLAKGDLSPGDAKAIEKVSRSLASDDSTDAPSEGAAVASNTPPVPAAERAAEPRTISRTPAARLIEPEVLAPVSLSPHETMAVQPPTSIENENYPAVEQAAPVHQRIRLYSPPAQARQPAAQASAPPASSFHFVLHSSPGEAPPAAVEDKSLRFKWGTWQISE